AIVDGGFNVTVLPGVHNVHATLTDYSTFEQNITTTAGNVSEVTVDLVAVHTSPGTGLGPTPTAGASPWSTPVILAIIAAVAIAVVVVAIWARGRRGGSSEVSAPED
ncbi:MAG: hypothetical protein L3K03_08305, partial [Thermoplasmata archaeon]|nr:hypothetical protein [Thermoplasmata archaeon]